MKVKLKRIQEFDEQITIPIYYSGDGSVVEVDLESMQEEFEEKIKELKNE